jgi:hypothetical protein
MKPLMQLAAVGVVGVVAWKILGLLVLPLLGTMLGFAFVALKIAFIVALAVMVMRWLRKGKKDAAPAAS